MMMRALDNCMAPAKLNLFLHVTGQRADGYHLLQTVFQLIDYGDTLHFSLREDGVIHRRTALEGVPEDADLAVRAARLLQSAIHRKKNTGAPGAEISIEKRLPMGGGLGGGSLVVVFSLLVLFFFWFGGF